METRILKVLRRIKTTFVIEEINHEDWEIIKQEIDKEFKEKTLYIGNRVTGVSPKDDEEHTGKIVNFTFTDCTGRLIKYVWIFDEKTMKRIYLDPETVNIIVPDNIDKNIRFNPFSTNFMGAHD